MTWPKNNADWWRAKIEANRARDLNTTRVLRRSGWSVVRVWEHQLVTAAARHIARVVDLRRRSTAALT